MKRHMGNLKLPPFKLPSPLPSITNLFTGAYTNFGAISSRLNPNSRAFHGINKREGRGEEGSKTPSATNR